MNRKLQWILLITVLVLAVSNLVVGRWMSIINRHDMMQSDALILESENIRFLSQRLDDIDAELDEECAPAQSN